MTPLQRLGLVAWWLGAILSSLLWGVALWILIAGERDSMSYAIGWGIASCIVAGLFWAIAFVLSGSFWRPPGPSR